MQASEIPCASISDIRTLDVHADAPCSDHPAALCRIIIATTIVPVNIIFMLASLIKIFNTMPILSRMHRAMAKAKAKAKAKSRAARSASGNETKNLRRTLRKAAIRDMLSVAGELQIASTVCPRSASNEEVERLLRNLERRATSTEHRDKLTAAAKQFVENGGHFTAPLADSADEVATASVVLKHRIFVPSFQLESKAFMLTFNSDTFCRDTWVRFEQFIRSIHKKFGARAWAACWEQSLHAVGTQQRFHGHAYFIWTDGVGFRHRDLQPLTFEGVRPRMDICTAKGATTTPRGPALHGLWYCSFAKNGTEFTATNYAAGQWYKPSPRWLEGLYQEKKLSYEAFVRTSAQLFPFGHSARKRDADEALRDSQHQGILDMVAKEEQLLAESGHLKQSRTFPEVEEFVNLFTPSTRLWRRPVLLIVGPTNTGKSMLANDVLKRVASVLGNGASGSLEVTVEGDGHLDLSDYNPLVHCGVVLDGVADTLQLRQHRESLQGRPKICKGAKSATMKYAYTYTFVRRAIVVTMDTSAVNLDLLHSDPWLSNRKNILQLHLDSPAWEGAQIPAAADEARDAATWKAADVLAFMKANDLEGPGSVLFANGVSGADLMAMTAECLVAEVRLSRFAANKVIAARDRLRER